MPGTADYQDSHLQIPRSTLGLELVIRYMPA
jgi:hypothetical protein